MSRLRALRRRISSSPAAARLAAGLPHGWLRLALRTGRWRVEGLDELRARLTNGPVIVALWHERILLGAPHWPHDAGPLIALHAHSPAGRVAGRLQEVFGVAPAEMASGGAAGLSATRTVLKGLKAGRSVAVTGDGPLGPARVMKDVALDWARASGAPVVLFAWGSKRQRRLSSWDRLVAPGLFDRGLVIFRTWDWTVPPRLTPDQREELRAALASDLSALCAEAEARA
ncbi:lysophospholipid acyltransferase family protein [Wenxinia marina]|uniref:DUF374 domain-containing protein n=1 Tax=Wenxinia marina DSM 24838 TaxID=1123501 RepID=A0A0D0Q3S2_9RHOB|nr:DUF374 domain-containing protein [Wenxinia marina]KIQ69159.1 hypothetical protein Wenmar_02229 [Wenxinia marina DSM 24838]GGL70835.1 hypothetical protein GCM10011392_26690 [Wenxinia marina]